MPFLKLSKLKLRELEYLQAALTLANKSTSSNLLVASLSCKIVHERPSRISLGVKAEKGQLAELEHAQVAEINLNQESEAV